MDSMLIEIPSSIIKLVKLLTSHAKYVRNNRQTFDILSSYLSFEGPTHSITNVRLQWKKPALNFAMEGSFKTWRWSILSSHSEKRASQSFDDWYSFARRKFLYTYKVHPVSM
jgi:hypothetical protein